jgi:hypothetical protein
MTLRTVKTQSEAGELLSIHRDTFRSRVAEGVYTWPAKSNADLVREHVKFEKAGHVIHTDDARFRRARADVHEIEAAKQRGDLAPVSLFEEQVVTIFGQFVHEAEGAEARLQRSAGATLSEAIRNEFRAMREHLARGVEEYCESLEERARSRTSGSGSTRRRVGANGTRIAGGERGARPL